MDRTRSLVSALVCEGADMLCWYAFASDIREQDSVRIARDARSAPLDNRMADLLEAARALALDRMLSSRLPPFRRYGPATHTMWRSYGSGQIDTSRVGLASAMGFPHGMPMLEQRHTRTIPEVVALRDALGAAILALEPGRIPAFLTMDARASCLRMRRLRSELEDSHPRIDASCSPRESALRSLDAIRHDPCMPGAEIHQGVSRLFCRDWDPGIVSDSGLDLPTLGGKNFADRALELLLLSRLRAWLDGSGAKGTWRLDRIRAADGHPVYEGSLIGKCVRIWYQSSKALPPVAAAGTGSRNYSLRTIPDVVMKVGSGAEEQTLIVDAKNYESRTGMWAQGCQCIGDATLRGIADKRVMLVRAAEEAEEDVYHVPGAGGYDLRIVDMPLGAEGIMMPGSVAAMMLGIGIHLAEMPEIAA